MNAVAVRTMLAAAAALAAAGLAIFVIAPRLQTEPPPLRIMPQEEPLSPDARKELEVESPSIPIKAFEDTTLVRFDLAKPLLETVYPPLRTRDIVWQSQVGFRRRSDQNRPTPWPEHPKGEWTLRTNHAGFRMDAELDLSKRTFAITGDSHLDGACSNDESVAGLVTAALATEDPELQVANVACGGYSLHQYLGALEFLCGDTPGELVDTDRAISLETLAVAIYGGNDFSELLKLRHEFRGTRRPLGWGRDNERAKPLRKASPSVFGQALSSLLYFRNAPSEIDVAMDEALAITEELERHANRRGIRLVFLYLPSAITSEPQLHEELLEPVAGALEITPEQLAEEDRLGDALIAGLQKQGADIIDVRPLLADGQQHFWSQDLHLNLKGQAVVAAALLDWYRQPAR